MTSDSRTIRLADANLANHAGYAVIYHLWQAQKEGAGWASAITDNAVMENSCKIGLVHAGSLPVRITHMERHNTTKEVMIAGEKEMVVLLAPPSSADHPSVDDIGLFVLCPGDVLVINEGVWHSACYGIDGEVCYYFLYHDTSEDVIWSEVSGGVVEVIK